MPSQAFRDLLAPTPSVEGARKDRAEGFAHLTGWLRTGRDGTFVLTTWPSASGAMHIEALVADVSEFRVLADHGPERRAVQVAVRAGAILRVTRQVPAEDAEFFQACVYRDIVASTSARRGRAPHDRAVESSDEPIEFGVDEEEEEAQEQAIAIARAAHEHERARRLAGLPKGRYEPPYQGRPLQPPPPPIGPADSSPISPGHEMGPQPPPP